MANDKGVHVFTPKETLSTRHIQPTNKERIKHAQQFREQKEHELKLKNERFDAIQARRKNKPGGSGGSGSGSGINIEVTDGD